MVMGMREKLIELLEGSLRYAGDVCGETGDCSKCQYDKYGANCGYAIRADYFIANGVTIPVRCKDCRKISPSVTPVKNAVWCREFRAYMPCDGFCSYGERREEE